MHRGLVSYARGLMPPQIRRNLKPRKTNLIAYELIAAVMTVFMLDQVLREKVAVRHFIDNRPARSCLVKGSSKQVDLNDISGLVWYTAAHRTHSYWSQWVCSTANLADKPSRQDLSVMKQLRGTEVEMNFSLYLAAAESWALTRKRQAMIA